MTRGTRRPSRARGPGAAGVMLGKEPGFRCGSSPAVRCSPRRPSPSPSASLPHPRPRPPERPATITPGGKITGNGPAMLGDPGAGATHYVRVPPEGTLQAGHGQANPIGKLTSVTFQQLHRPGRSDLHGDSVRIGRQGPVAHRRHQLQHRRDPRKHGRHNDRHHRRRMQCINASNGGHVGHVPLARSTSPIPTERTSCKTSGGNLHIWNLSKLPRYLQQRRQRLIRRQLHDDP